jgi:hypothetical protein
MRKLIAAGLAAAISYPAAAAPAPPPIIITPTSPSFGSWRTSDEGDYTEAYTGNESGSTFGILCGKTCIFYVDMQTTCNDGEAYPAMVNSQAGAVTVSLKCHKLDRRFVLSSDSTNSYIDILKKGGEIGFAVPLQSGMFGVSRFSLDGGAQAVGVAVQAAINKSAKQQRGLRDFNI